MSNYTPEQIRRTGLAQRTTWQRLLNRLRRQPAHRVDEAFAQAHEAVFEQMDCLQCANCCRTTSPLFREADIRQLARHLRMKEGDFVARYLHRDEDGDWVLNVAPCPFLGADNYCSVYDHRPRACREYPHTDRKAMHGILTLTLKNSEICPAVQQVLTLLDSSSQA